MKIIAFDQATYTTGVAVLFDGYITSHTKYETKDKSLMVRMEKIYQYVRQLISDESPDKVVLEGVQFRQNYRVYSELSQLQGVIFASCFERGIPVTVLQPSAWRSIVGITSKHRADQKKEAVETVNKMGVEETSDDICEAILMAIAEYKKVTQ